ncbi:hypothetical protein [Rhizobium laguerreae]|uniref:hypothetical protein n=1 Tax=Rhizobium laguerreae TaxID=1076926 RepID=UPI001C9051FD|nr:hypothetical protein [Rhizobium laguerreae]MBY3556432.1 hypothetical protein [Rhizobium laguerreae]
MLPNSERFHSQFPSFGFNVPPWGVECDDGWLPILSDFCISVTAAVTAGEFSLRQVKEKLGALQIYFTLSGVSPETELAVNNARQLAFQRSLHICEVCGKRGRLHSFDGLYKTVCQDHANVEFGTGAPVEQLDHGIGDSAYDPDTDPFITVRPTAQEFHAAPLLIGWAPADDGLPWMHAWFFDHPEIADGTHGHTSPLVMVDDVNPPHWARTDSRLYRLGVFFQPAEREVRYWTQKHLGAPVEKGTVPGGDVEIDRMLAFLRSTGRLRPTMVDRLEQAYRLERGFIGESCEGT